MLQTLLAHVVFSSVRIKASLCSYYGKSEILCSLKQQDLLLTEVLLGGFAHRWIPGLPGSCLPCRRAAALGGFGLANGCSGLEVSFICSQLIGQKEPRSPTQPQRVYIAQRACRGRELMLLVNSISDCCLWFLGLHASCPEASDEIWLKNYF